MSRQGESPTLVARRWSDAWTEALAATLAFAFAALVLFGGAARSAPHGARSVLAAALLFTVLVGTYLALSVHTVVRALRAVASRRGATAGALLGVGLLWLASVAYAALAGLDVLVRAAAFAPYLALPALLLVAGGSDREPSATPRRSPPLRELAAIALFWLPIEFRLLPPLPVPADAGGYDVSRFVGLVAALFLFLVARPLDGIGYTFALRGREVATAVVAFLRYSVVALPIGFASGFITWAPRVSVGQLTAIPLLIYLATAVPEEFLFRGLIQNLLTRSWGARWGLGVTAVVFGLAHLPDPRYVLLATFAGVAYGWVYLRTGRITAAAVTHALVDASWVVLLRG